MAPALQAASWDNNAADAAIDLATEGSKLNDLKKAGSFEKEDKTFVEAMDLGRKATLEVLKVSQGLVLPATTRCKLFPSCNHRTRVSVQNVALTSTPIPCCSGKNGVIRPLKF